MYLHSIFLRNSDDSAIPRQIALNIESLKHHHPSFAHIVYDNDMARDFISSHYDVEVLLAYDSLVPLAYKADLLRYCLLYKLGGLYADISVYFFGPLLTNNNSKMLYLFRDGFSEAPWIVSNSLIYSPAGEKIFETCISEIIHNVRSEFYGVTPLCPTGPNLFGRNCAMLVSLNKIICGDTLRINKNPATHSWAYVSKEGDTIAVNVKKGAGISSLGANVDCDYNKLYHENNIYASRVGSIHKWDISKYIEKNYLQSNEYKPSDLADRFYREGYSIIGPYIRLQPGCYQARMFVKASNAFSVKELYYMVDVCYDFGKEIISHSNPNKIHLSDRISEIRFEFTLSLECRNVEVKSWLRKFGQ